MGKGSSKKRIVLSVALATLAGLLLEPELQRHLPFVWFFGALTFTAWYAGFRPAILATILSGVLAAYLFLPPDDSLKVDELVDQLALIVFLAIGMAIALYSRRVAFLREIVRMPEEQLRAFQSLPAWESRVAAAHTIVREVREQSKHYSFRPEKFQTMRVPTLLLLGSASPAYFKAAIDLVHKALPASRIALLAGQQHAAMDTGKEIFLKPVLEFLAQ